MNIDEIINTINKSNTIKSLEEIYHSLFSKTGYFANEMKLLATLSIEEKKEKGKMLNEAKTNLQYMISSKQESLRIKEISEKAAKEYLDLTLPINPLIKGGLHPISHAIEQIIAIFSDLGFKVAFNSEIEDDWHNFTALNIPEHHPARQDHDTFYLNMLDHKGDKKLLRTHTSNVQIKTMVQNKDFPIKIIAPGRTYRSDSDATHSPMFHQVEGLYVDKKENVSIPLLKAVLLDFCSKFFEVENLPIRLRPSYFPFTAPSYEADILCDKSGSQLIIGSGNSWLEILGSGIIHPKVLENCGINSEEYSGFAFGMGIERIVMLKYGFKDLRSFFLGDKRWLSYYNANVLKTPSIFSGLN